MDVFTTVQLTATDLFSGVHVLTVLSSVLMDMTAMKVRLVYSKNIYTLVRISPTMHESYIDICSSFLCRV